MPGFLKLLVYTIIMCVCVSTNVKFLPTSGHFFTSDWINDHNSAILVPINFYLTSFYLSHAYNSDVMKKSCDTKWLPRTSVTQVSYHHNARQEVCPFVSSESLYIFNLMQKHLRCKKSATK